MARTNAQLDEQFRKIMDEIEAANPYETFEPHPEEEDTGDIVELYEARLRKLFVEKVVNGQDQELSRYLLNIVGDEIKRDKH
jgi:hypothetical protein